LTLALVAGSIFAGRSIGRRGLRRTAIFGGLLAVGGFGLAYTMAADTPLWRAMASMVVLGAGVGTLLVSMVVAMQLDTPPEYMGVSSSLSRSFGTRGGLLGSTLSAALRPRLFRRSANDWDEALREALSSLGGMKKIGNALFERSSLLPASSIE